MTTLAGAVVIALLLYAIVLNGLYLAQRRLLFRPDTNLSPPQLLGLPEVEVVSLRADDGNPLFGWFTGPAQPGGYVVLYLHGNAGHIGHRANRLRRMAEFGWGVFLLEYRGYGGNPGQPTEAGLMRDARAGLARLHASGIPDQRILLWGESLGTGLAIALAVD